VRGRGSLAAGADGAVDRGVGVVDLVLVSPVLRGHGRPPFSSAAEQRPGQNG